MASYKNVTAEIQQSNLSLVGFSCSCNFHFKHCSAQKRSNIRVRRQQQFTVTTTSSQLSNRCLWSLPSRKNTQVEVVGHLVSYCIAFFLRLETSTATEMIPQRRAAMAKWLQSRTFPCWNRYWNSLSANVMLSYLRKLPEETPEEGSGQHLANCKRQAEDECESNVNDNKRRRRKQSMLWEICSLLHFIVLCCSSAVLSVKVK